MTPKERQWEIDGLTFSALEWGPEDGTPVLALHGWMDHADSFAELAPRLTGCRVIALDLSGQGLSGHRAPHATYNIWDDLPQIAELLDRLSWEKTVLVGHSRGAIIAALLAAALPEKVGALVALDALLPEPTPSDAVVKTLRAFIEGTRKQISRPPRSFASHAAYIDRRGEQGNSRRTSEALAKRALAEVGDAFLMRGDPRLFASSAVKLNREQIEAVMQAITCPVLNIWATGGLKLSRPHAAETGQRAADVIADYTLLDIEGDHHFHLDPDAASKIASAVSAFLARTGTGPT